LIFVTGVNHLVNPTSRKGYKEERKKKKKTENENTALNCFGVDTSASFCYGDVERECK